VTPFEPALEAAATRLAKPQGIDPANVQHPEGTDPAEARWDNFDPPGLLLLPGLRALVAAASSSEPGDTGQHFIRAEQP
jgi:hypothetical protein